MIVARICDIESGKCGEWKTERMIMDDIFNGIDFIYRHGNLELLKSYGQED